MHEILCFVGKLVRTGIILESAAQWDCQLSKEV